jgi:hypothetical protein
MKRLLSCELWPRSLAVIQRFTMPSFFARAGPTTPKQLGMKHQTCPNGEELYQIMHIGHARRPRKAGSRRGQIPQNRGLGIRVPPRGAESPPPLRGDDRPRPVRRLDRDHPIRTQPVRPNSLVFQVNLIASRRRDSHGQ